MNVSLRLGRGLASFDQQKEQTFRWGLGRVGLVGYGFLAGQRLLALLTCLAPSQGEGTDAVAQHLNRCGSCSWWRTLCLTTPSWWSMAGTLWAQLPTW